MATYLRLFDSTQQFQLKNGALNVYGRIFVYLAETDDLADIYDENGTQLQQPAILDNNGRARGLFVDAAKTYWIDVQDQYGESLFTIRKMTPCGGGGGSSLSGTYDIVSSDGSLVVEKSIDAGVTTFDLGVANDSAEALEWVKCSNENISNGAVYPLYGEGTMIVFPNQGLEVFADRCYHITCTVKVDPTGTGVNYATLSANLMFTDGGEPVTVTRRNYDVDTSVNDPVLCEFSYDFLPSAYGFVYFNIEGVAQFEHVSVDMQVHRVYSGLPELPGNIQARLVPGPGISINGDVISVDGSFTQVQSDWDQTDPTAVDYIKNKPNIASTLTAGDGIDITNNVITAKVDGTSVTINSDGELQASGSSATVDQTYDPTSANAQSGVAIAGALADYTPTSSLATVATTGAYSDLSGTPDLSQYATTTDLAGKADKVTGATAGDIAVLDANGNLTDTGVSATNLVHDSAYVHTDENFTSAEKTKLSGIASGAEVNVQADWAETNTASDAYIANKPANLVQDANYVHTDNNFTNADVTKLSGIATGAEVNVQANWAETDSSSDAYIANKPANLVQDANYVHTDNNFTNADASKLSGIAAGAEVNVQSDWNQTDSSADDFIKNKPTIPPGVTVDQTYNSSSTNAQSGTAVAEAIGTVNQVPSSSSTDEGKVLTVDSQGDPVWAAAQAPISAGNGIDITNNVVSVDLDGSTLTNGANGLSVTNPVPTTTGASQGDVLTIGQNGLEWVAQNTEIFLATYGTTSFADIQTAHNAGKAVFLYRAQTGTRWGYLLPLSLLFDNGGSGSSNTAEFEEPMSSSAGGYVATCQVYSVKKSNNAWSVYYKYSVAQPLAADNGKVLQCNGADKAVWASISQVPSSTASDENKVLTVNSSGNAEWVTPTAVPVIGTITV